MERKRIYKKQTEIVNIELVLSNDDIDELSRKLPSTLEELMNPFIHIALEIKKKECMQNFVEEIKHFITMEGIVKSEFAIPGTVPLTIC